MSFATNPHLGSSAITSPLLQFGATTTTSTLKVTKKALAEFDAEYSATMQTDAIISKPTVHAKNTSKIAYYIVVQYSTAQKFNLSIQDKPYSRSLNVTLPQCSLYNAATMKYVSCVNCNISSYTDYNATFGCHDIRNLCPVSSKSRRLQAYHEHGDDQNSLRGLYPEAFDDEGEYEEDEEDEQWTNEFEDNVDIHTDIHTDADENEGGNEGESEGESEGSSVRSQWARIRKLKDAGSDSNSTTAKDDDYQPSADDGPAAADDQYTSKNQASASEFGSIFSAIAAELASVLSLNPFAIDLSKATVTLSFVGSLAVCIVIGIIYFLRWDKKDRHQAVYLLDAKRRYTKNAVHEDLMKGGTGVHSGLDEFKVNEDKEDLRQLLNSAITKFSSRTLSLGNLSSGKMSTGDSLSKDGITNTSAKLSHSTLNSTIEESEENTEKDTHNDSSPAVLVAHFSNEILPKEYLVKDANRLKQSFTFEDTIHILQRTHYISHMFFGSSLADSRTLRFLEMCRIVLLGLFIDTVIYGVFFPAGSVCEELTTKLTCLAIPSKIISGATLCMWDKANGCTVQPRPASVTFTLLIAFVITMFILPFDFLVGYIQEEYGAKRPTLELWGIDSNSWLGSVFHRRATDKSPLAVAMKMTEESREESNYEIMEKGVMEEDAHTKAVFGEFSSPAEEFEAIMEKAHRLISSATARDNEVPWRDAMLADRIAGDRLASLAVTRNQLMMNVDGTPKPLTFRQRLFYTSREELLAQKVEVARKKAAKMCGVLGEMEVKSTHFKDVALMRFFILEQVSLFNRFSLKRCFQRIDGTTPENIHPLKWIIAWMIISGCLIFFLYWIFAWGVTNGGATLNDWGKDYGVSVIQDICICETMKLCIMFIFAIMSSKPQLQVIKRIINDIALRLMQDSGESTDDFNFIQHFSPSCRAAHLNEIRDLPASAILRCD